jgi:hypothetical protein
MPIPREDQVQPIQYDEPNFNPSATLDSTRFYDISQQQLYNAALIYRVGVNMGMTRRDIQIALITAMVESNLINVNHGDRDSLGLFQQRPSQGWGSPEQVMNPEYAANQFFSHLRNLGEQRYSMTMGEAAQAVQRSAYPDRYGKMIPIVQSFWPTVQQAAGKSAQSLDGGPYVPNVGYDNYITGAAYEMGLPPQNPTVGPVAPGLDPQTLTGLTDALDAGPVTPSAEDMLGAWGMGSQTVGVPGDSMGSGFAPRNDFLDDIMPVINPGTNAQVIAPMQQEMGGFTQGVDGWRKAVIAAARSALGTPYTWGGNSLQGGVDCSGLIQQAFAAAGISIPRVSYAQANFGQRVGLDALRPGDLVAWDNSSRNNGADHIALYIGNGQIIEAARPGTAVRIRTLGEDEDAWGVQLNFDRR